jgi:hypothetical protein
LQTKVFGYGTKEMVGVGRKKMCSHIFSVGVTQRGFTSTKTQVVERYITTQRLKPLRLKIN